MIFSGVLERHSTLKVVIVLWGQCMTTIGTLPWRRAMATETSSP